MRRITLLLVIFLGISTFAKAQTVYPVKPVSAEELSRLRQIPEWRPSLMSRQEALPASVDNSLLKYFPPVFSQRGNSCSQASGVRYVFTYEMNRMLNRSADQPGHIFSYHFTWNYLNEGNNEGSFPHRGYDMMKVNGAATLTDMNDESDAVSSTTWLTGYDPYIRAMKYRVKEYYKFTLKKQEGIDRLKHYLYNRGESGMDGGVVTFSCKTGNWELESFYNGPAHAPIRHLVTQPGTDGAHALTIVGYDDTVAYDLNGDEQITDDEKGAFIVVNTWGTYWGSSGKAYYPYKYFLLPAAEGGLADLDAEALAMEPEIHEPKMIFKIKLTYSSRDDLHFQLGAADGQSATAPTVLLTSPSMWQQGGDHYMRGASANEAFKTIEVALNFTDKLPAIESFESPKFFLIIRKIFHGKVLGDGTVNSFSVLDTRTDTEYACLAANVPIKGETILSTGSQPKEPVSMSPVPWLNESSFPQPSPFIIKDAEGKQYKLLFQGYDKKNGKLTIRYQKLQ